MIIYYIFCGLKHVCSHFLHLFTLLITFLFKCTQCQYVTLYIQPALARYLDGCLCFAGYVHLANDLLEYNTHSLLFCWMHVVLNIYVMVYHENISFIIFQITQYLLWLCRTVVWDMIQYVNIDKDTFKSLKQLSFCSTYYVVSGMHFRPFAVILCMPY